MAPRRALIEPPQRRAEIDLQINRLNTNADGSVDRYFGLRAPAGFAGDWIQTVPGRARFAYFRCSGPTKASYDKSWALPAIPARVGDQLPAFFDPFPMSVLRRRKLGFSCSMSASNRAASLRSVRRLPTKRAL